VRAVVFAYHEIGSACLEELTNSAIEVAALFTHRDDPHEEIWFRTPRIIAEKSGIPVFDEDSLNNPLWIDRIRSFNPDYIFSFYYRNMLPKEILDIPRVAAMNLHGSLLPKFRGRCPVNWVILKGEKETGVTLHIMEVKPDAGDIVAQKSVPIDFNDTAHTLALKLTSAARDLMRHTSPQLETGSFERRPQVGSSSYFGGRKPEDGLIDWTRNAEEIYNLVRAVTHPYPGAFTFLDGKKLFIWKALPVAENAGNKAGTRVSANPLTIAAGSGCLQILSAQVEGEDELDGETFLKYHALENKSLGGTF
jgi:methionyl-tRNA formyltransferase